MTTEQLNRGNHLIHQINRCDKILNEFTEAHSKLPIETINVYWRDKRTEVICLKYETEFDIGLDDAIDLIYKKIENMRSAFQAEFDRI